MQIDDVVEYIGDSLMIPPQLTVLKKMGIKPTLKDGDMAEIGTILVICMHNMSEKCIMSKITGGKLQALVVRGDNVVYDYQEKVFVMFDKYFNMLEFSERELFIKNIFFHVRKTVRTKQMGFLLDILLENYQLPLMYMPRWGSFVDCLDTLEVAPIDGVPVNIYPWKYLPWIGKADRDKKILNQLTFSEKLSDFKKAGFNLRTLDYYYALTTPITRMFSGTIAFQDFEDYLDELNFHTAYEMLDIFSNDNKLEKSIDELLEKDNVGEVFSLIVVLLTLKKVDRERFESILSELKDIIIKSLKKESYSPSFSLLGEVIFSYFEVTETENKYGMYYENGTKVCHWIRKEDLLRNLIVIEDGELVNQKFPGLNHSIIDGEKDNRIYLKKKLLALNTLFSETLPDNELEIAVRKMMEEILEGVLKLQNNALSRFTVEAKSCGIDMTGLAVSLKEMTHFYTRKKQSVFRLKIVGLNKEHFEDVIKLGQEILMSEPRDFSDIKVEVLISQMKRANNKTDIN